MDSETGSENDVQDGLRNEHHPVPRDPEPVGREDPTDDEADGEAPGINEAAGPAEEEDRDAEDDRDLTTDTSPSD